MARHDEYDGSREPVLNCPPCSVGRKRAREIPDSSEAGCVFVRVSSSGEDWRDGWVHGNPAKLRRYVLRTGETLCLRDVKCCSRVGGVQLGCGCV